MKNYTTPEQPRVRPGRNDGLIWYCCPDCGMKLFKVKPNATATGIEIKCKKCKTIINVSL